MMAKNWTLRQGYRVDCVIGSGFLPNGVGEPIALFDRRDGVVHGRNEYGTWDVSWPNGETYSYDAALLMITAR